MLKLSTKLLSNMFNMTTVDLKDKVAIVTGASSGIGAATVKALLNIGRRVVGFARRKKRIEDLVENHNGKLFALRVDLTKPQEIIDGFAWVTKNVGPIYVLVNNAGAGSDSSVITGNLEAWQNTMDTNFMSVAITCKESIKMMQEHNIDGYIININSIFGYYGSGRPSIAMYVSSKCALKSLTENIRLELARMNSKIKIMTLSPGVVKTEIITSNFDPETSAKFFGNIPYLLREDIADTIVYLLSTPQRVHISEIMVRPLGEDPSKIILE